MTIGDEKAYTTVSALQQKMRKHKGLETVRGLEPFLLEMQEQNLLEICKTGKNKRILYVSPYLKAPSGKLPECSLVPA